MSNDNSGDGSDMPINRRNVLQVTGTGFLGPAITPAASAQEAGTELNEMWSVGLSQEKQRMVVTDYDGDLKDEVGISNWNSSSTFGAISNGEWDWQRNDGSTVIPRAAGDISGDGSDEIIFAGKVSNRWVRPYTANSDYLWSDDHPDWVDNCIVTDSLEGYQAAVCATSQNNGDISVWDSAGNVIWQANSDKISFTPFDFYDVDNDGMGEILESDEGLVLLGQDSSGNAEVRWEYGPNELVRAKFIKNTHVSILAAYPDSGEVHLVNKDGTNEWKKDIGTTNTEGRVYETPLTDGPFAIFWTNAEVIIVDGESRETTSFELDFEIKRAYLYDDTTVIVETNNRIIVVDENDGEISSVSKDNSINELAIGDLSGSDKYDIVILYSNKLTAVTGESLASASSGSGTTLNASFTYSPAEPQLSETVTFDASGSNGDIAEYRWDFADDGTTDVTGETVEWNFEESGNNSVSLIVATQDGTTDTSTEVVPVEVQTGQLDATVVGDTNALPDGVDAYAIDAVRKHEALDYIGGSQSSIPTYLAGGTLDDSYTVSFGSVEVGEYVVLVDANAEDNNLDSFLQDDISVVSGETTTAEVPFAPDRPLQPLADVLKSTKTTAIDRNTASLTPLAEVYIDGYNLFESPGLDGADYLDAALSLTNFALGLADPDSAFTAAQETKAFAAEQLSMPIAEAGYHEALATQWEEVNGTTYQSELTGYTEDLQAADGILDFGPTGSVAEAETAFEQTTIHNETIAAIEDALETFTTETVFTDPPDGFALSEVKSILESQRTWLDDGGLAPGVVFTPRDEEYLVGELEYHAAAFQNVESNFETAEDLNLVAQGVSAAGKGIALAGGWTVAGLAVGTVAKVAGSVGSLALQMYQVHAKNQLADTWVRSLTYWVSDLNDTKQAYSGLVTWVETELNEPTPLAAIDGTLTTSLDGFSPPGTDETFLLANRPTYPSWWTLPAPQLKHVGTVEVTVENTGSEPAEARIMLSIRAGDSDAGGVTPSDAMSMHPEPDDPPLQLSAGETKTVELDYRADFELVDALSWQVMSTALWMDGKFVEETNDSFYVVPSTSAVSGQSAGPSSERAGDSSEPATIGFSTTDDGSASTQASSSAYGETVDVIQGATVSPDDPTATTTYEPGTDLDTITFVLQGVPEADIHLHIYDEQDRHIGFDAGTDTDVVEIPDGTYNGSDSNLEVITVPAAVVETLDVTATAKSFTSGQPVELTVQAVEVPTRGAVLSTAGSAVTTVLSPGETRDFDIDIREIGKQTTLESVTPVAPSLERSDGSSFDAAGGSATFGPEGFDVAAGEAEQAGLSLSAAESLTLPDGPETRFDGTATIESANTESVEVPVSVLVLDTDVADTRLTSATASVAGTSLSVTDVGDLSADTVPEGVEPIAAYEVDSVLADGADGGEFSVAVPDRWDSDAVAMYIADGGTWGEATWEQVSGELIATVAGGNAVTVVIAAERYTLPAYTTNGGRVDNDGLRESVDDWRNGDVETGVLRDVVDYWRTGEPVG